MSSTTPANNSGSQGLPAVQRQIVLPMSKAVEIAWKNIRMRLSRSLLVTSGIVLALAFLMAIRVDEALVNGMRAWKETADTTPAFDALRTTKDGLEQKIQSADQELRAVAAKPPAVPAGAARVDPRTLFGKGFSDIQKELGGTSLPGSSVGLVEAMTADVKYVQMMRSWIDLQRQLRAVKYDLLGPQRLEALMKAEGVATTAQEIEASRIQTRWLLGLALLVAFVGILNSMLMSVTERFREIGTMKCLGALDAFIVKLFLIESLFQGMVGTTLGIIIGLFLSIAGSAMTYGDFVWKNIPAGQIVSGVGLCAVVGVGLTVAGAVYPAWQAARMQPIEAMRADT